MHFGVQAQAKGVDRLKYTCVLDYAKTHKALGSMHIRSTCGFCAALLAKVIHASLSDISP